MPPTGPEGQTAPGPEALDWRVFDATNAPVNLPEEVVLRRVKVRFQDGKVVVSKNPPVTIQGFQGGLTPQVSDQVYELVARFAVVGSSTASSKLPLVTGLAAQPMVDAPFMSLFKP